MKKCPCCKGDISFYNFYKSWQKSSKMNDSFLHCTACNSSIGKIKQYNKYMWIGAIPLFGFFFMNTSWLMTILILIYGVAVLLYLHIGIPFKCLDSKSKEIMIDEKIDDIKERNNRVIIILTTLLSFIFLVWILMTKSLNYKEKQQTYNQQHEKSDKQIITKEL